MTEPTTINVGLIIPNTGDLVGVWGSQAINPDLTAVDGYLGGVQSISVTNAAVTLTAPSGFSPAPSSGPTQAQNCILRFSGALTANVPVTLPLPGRYIVENLTTGAFVLTLQAATAGEIVGIDQGDRVTVYCDGANVRFADLGRPAKMEFWAGVSAIPAWVRACTVQPWLLCDGAVYNISAFPFLGSKLNAIFGGNGATTFGTPDLQGAIPLAYDGTGVRITAAGSGLNGQTLGASLYSTQSVTLNINQIPSHSHSVIDPGHTHSTNAINTANNGGAVPNGASPIQSTPAQATINPSNTGISIVANGGNGPHENLQPSQVVGIWVIKT